MSDAFERRAPRAIWDPRFVAARAFDVRAYFTHRAAALIAFVGRELADIDGRFAATALAFAAWGFFTIHWDMVKAIQFLRSGCARIKLKAACTIRCHG